jgi:hypothetical protein
MSKDIWHKADITPEPCRILICKTNKGQKYTAIIPSTQEWNTMILPEFYSLGDIDNAERIEQYAYLDDLLALETELNRTRKALDRAKWWLHEIVENHRYTPISTAEMALKEITALEQKDVK